MNAGMVMLEQPMLLEQQLPFLEIVRNDAPIINGSRVNVSGSSNACLLYTSPSPRD